MLDVPWEVQGQRVLNEIVTGVIPLEIGRNTIRGKPDLWSIHHWRHTNAFPASTLGYEKGRTDIGLRERFVRPPSEKDGYRVEDCRAPRERRMLQFLVPIFNPDKPTTCTI